MRHLQRLIVRALWLACELLDHLPGPARQLGCRLRLAWWSSELDERWHVGFWEDLEDAADIKAAQEALADPEPSIPFDQVKAELGWDDE